MRGHKNGAAGGQIEAPVDEVEQLRAELARWKGYCGDQEPPEGETWPDIAARTHQDWETADEDIAESYRILEAAGALRDRVTLAQQVAALVQERNRLEEERMCLEIMNNWQHVSDYLLAQMTGGRAGTSEGQMNRRLNVDRLDGRALVGRYVDRLVDYLPVPTQVVRQRDELLAAVGKAVEQLNQVLTVDVMNLDDEEMAEHLTGEVLPNLFDELLRVFYAAGGKLDVGPEI